MFQSTYLYKVRLARYRANVARFGFNPRTYIRYDESSAFTIIGFIVSIHVPI